MLIRVNHPDEVAYGSMGFDRVTEADRWVDGIGVPSAGFLAGQNASSLEFRDDFVHGPLGDPNPPRKVPDPQVWLQRQTEQDMRVIG